MLCDIDVLLHADDCAGMSIRNDVEPPRSTPIPTGTTTPDPIYKVSPDYPPEAKSKRVSGVVLLAVIVNENGEIYEARVLRGNTLLSRAALAAVRKWRYKPAKVDGKIVPLTFTIPITFSLHSVDWGRERPSTDRTIATPLASPLR